MILMKGFSHLPTSEQKINKNRENEEKLEFHLRFPLKKGERERIKSSLYIASDILPSPYQGNGGVLTKTACFKGNYVYCLGEENTEWPRAIPPPKKKPGNFMPETGEIAIVLTHPECGKY